MIFDDYEHIEDYSYQELKIVVDEWWNSLNDEQKYFQNLDPDPSFEMYILSSMKRTQNVSINYTKNEYNFYPNIKEVRNEKINNILNG